MKWGIILLVTLILTFLTIGVSALDYSFINIYVKENGDALLVGDSKNIINISGIENHGEKVSGKTSELTAKEGSTWYFGINFDFPAVLNVILPRGAKIVGIETKNNYSIGIENNRVIISIVGEKPEIYVEYKVEDYSREGFSLFGLGLFIIFLFLIVFFFINKKSKEKRLEIIKEMLNEKEKEIIKKLEELKKKKVKIKQSQLSKMINIPKASLSRYLLNLEKKGIIKREGGRNKYIELKN